MADTTQQTLRTYTVKEVAAIHDVTEDAILKRIERGTLTASKNKRGRWCITLPDNEPDIAPDDPDITPDIPDELPDIKPDNQTSAGQDTLTSGSNEEFAVLRVKCAMLESENGYLREQLSTALQTVNQQAAALDRQANAALADEMGDIHARQLTVPASPKIDSPQPQKRPWWKLKLW